MFDALERNQDEDKKTLRIIIPFFSALFGILYTIHYPGFSANTKEKKYHG